MSNTYRSDKKGYVVNAHFDRDEALFLAKLIRTHYENHPDTSEFPLLVSCAQYLLEYSNRRKTDRRKN